MHQTQPAPEDPELTEASRAPRTLAEALEHWESQRRRNQQIRERYQRDHGKVLVRSAASLPAWAA